MVLGVLVQALEQTGKKSTESSTKPVPVQDIVYNRRVVMN
jgi:hypothetical protein